MAISPRINYPDGSGTSTDFAITTNSSSLVFTGTLDPSTVDVQIDFNGSGFVSDPTLVDVTLPTFTVPNLSTRPGGLQLERGTNTIRLRSVDVSGSVSPASTVTATVVSDVEMGGAFAPPTGLTVKRNASSVDVSWSDEFVSQAAGFNVYASTGAGGTRSGYLRLNSELIPASSPKETVVSEIFPSETSYDYSETEARDLVVTVSTVDSATGGDRVTKTSNSYPLVSAPNYRVKVTFSRLETFRFFSFVHDRTSPSTQHFDTFAVLQPSDPAYYVVTAVYYDRNTGTMQESRFSLETPGAPLPLDTNVRGIRIRDQSQIAQEYMKKVGQTEPTLSLIPGSTIREVHIEPFSNEIQKVYFLLDFVHRAKSFPALLAIDDPSLTGTSVPVSQSQYKQNLKTALSVADDSAVQTFIDSSFDALAKNFGKSRAVNLFATVELTYYTTRRPTSDLYVRQGAVATSDVAGSPRYVVKGQSVIPVAQAQSFYNPASRRWEIRVQAVADVPGLSGNVSAGSITTAASGASGLSVTNESAGHGGADAWSNLQLAEVSVRTLVSVDTGTAGGYAATATATPGVEDYKIVRSGDPYMMRDWDPVRKLHTGGKVDVYVKGTVERTVTETFAFQFDVAKSVRFDVVDSSTLLFRARDSRLSPSNPIEEMLFNPAEGFGLRNHANFPTSSYDLTGVTIVDYRTISLNAAIPQPVTLQDDFIEGDFRFLNNSRFIPTVQPIRSVTSVVGEVSGPVLSDGFSLFKLEDPLLRGESTGASDYVEIVQIDNVPNGSPLVVNDEQHVLVGQIDEPLGAVGINVFTLKVYSPDRTILYNGPDASEPDYVISGGSQTSAISISRTTASSIPNGSVVSVDYEHDENFVVTYVVNDVLQRVNDAVQVSRHLTADVLVKQAVENPLDVEATVQLASGAIRSTSDSEVRTRYSSMILQRRIGEDTHQSDVSASIDGSLGVDFVVQPFTRMSLRDGAVRIRDEVPSGSVFLPELSAGIAAAYILTEPLPFSTSDGGGPLNLFRGVFSDDRPMSLVSSLLHVVPTPNSAWIIGSGGAVIPGYSDDDTLLPTYLTAAAVLEARRNLTANRLVVSLDFSISDVPDNHAFSASYVVSGDVGSKDVAVSQIEYLDPGALTITYRGA